MLHQLDEQEIIADVIDDIIDDLEEEEYQLQVPGGGQPPTTHHSLLSCALFLRLLSHLLQFFSFFF